MADGHTSQGNIAIYDIHETHYPYVNVKQDYFNPLMSRVRRVLGEYNPFSYPQISSQQNIAFGLRYGSQWYSPDAYPNAIHFQRMFPTHYDPLATERTPTVSPLIQASAPAPHSTYTFTSDKLPRGCVRTIQFYKRCVMVNDTNKCGKEANEIVEICPNWALESMKEKGRFVAKAEAVQNLQYRAAMEESPYNKGRTPSDVSEKTWLKGTRQYLRPDTMWADERYSKITQADVNAAKERVAQREAHQKKQHDLDKQHHGHGKEHGHAEGHGHGHGHHDFTHVAYKEKRPMYP